VARRAARLRAGMGRPSLCCCRLRCGGLVWPIIIIAVIFILYLYILLINSHVVFCTLIRRSTLARANVGPFPFTATPRAHAHHFSLHRAFSCSRRRCAIAIATRNDVGARARLQEPVVDEMRRCATATATMPGHARACRNCSPRSLPSPLSSSSPPSPMPSPPSTCRYGPHPALPTQTQYSADCVPLHRHQRRGGGGLRLAVLALVFCSLLVSIAFLFNRFPAGESS
jgi:hypothetical protein